MQPAKEAVKAITALILGFTAGRVSGAEHEAPMPEVVVVEPAKSSECSTTGFKGSVDAGALEDLLNGIPFGAVIYSQPKADGMRLLWSNDTSVNLLGTRVRYMLGSSAYEIFPSLDNEEGRTLMAMYELAAIDRRAVDLGVIAYGDDRSESRLYETRILPVGDDMLAVAFAPIGDVGSDIQGVVMSPDQKVELRMEAVERVMDQVIRRSQSGD